MADNCAATCGLCSGGALAGAGAAPRPVCVDSNPKYVAVLKSIICTYGNPMNLVASTGTLDGSARRRSTRMPKSASTARKLADTARHREFFRKHGSKAVFFHILCITICYYCQCFCLPLFIKCNRRKGSVSIRMFAFSMIF